MTGLRPIEPGVTHSLGLKMTFNTLDDQHCLTSSVFPRRKHSPQRFYCTHMVRVKLCDRGAAVATTSPLIVCA